MRVAFNPMLFFHNPIPDISSWRKAYCNKRNQNLVMLAYSHFPYIEEYNQYQNNVNDKCNEANYNFDTHIGGLWLLSEERISNFRE
jgi:hypothetical protein